MSEAGDCGQDSVKRTERKLKRRSKAQEFEKREVGGGGLEEDLEAYKKKERQKRKKMKERRKKDDDDQTITSDQKPVAQKLNDPLSNSVIKNTAFMKSYFAPPGVNYDDVARKSPLHIYSSKSDSKKFGRFQNGTADFGTFSRALNADVSEDLRKVLKTTKGSVSRYDEDSDACEISARFSSAGGASKTSSKAKTENRFEEFLMNIKRGEGDDEDKSEKEGRGDRKVAKGTRKPISELDRMLRSRIEGNQKIDE